MWYSTHLILFTCLSCQEETGDSNAAQVLGTSLTERWGIEREKERYESHVTNDHITSSIPIRLLKVMSVPLTVNYCIFHLHRLVTTVFLGFWINHVTRHRKIYRNIKSVGNSVSTVQRWKKYHGLNHIAGLPPASTSFMLLPAFCSSMKKPQETLTHATPQRPCFLNLWEHTATQEYNFEPYTHRLQYLPH